MKKYASIYNHILISILALTPLLLSAAELNNETHAALEADRKAILSMLGEYKVGFHFQETVALKAGYVIKPVKNSGGYETVILVEDSPSKIVLQHILVSDKGEVTKHWRQDWTYQAKTRFEFTDDQTFSRVAISPEKTAGAWTQCVFEVSDAPRYCGTGKWNHRYHNPTWTSDRTWRPLPRREYTTRSDYNALNVENRHTITPNGWAHEQDNSKVVRSNLAESSTLVREFGFNDYQKISGHNFSPAYTYWEKTKGYWARVRAEWQKQLSNGDRLLLKTKVDGMPIIVATFTQAERVEKGGQVKDADIVTIFEKFTITK
jgi:hypothetical protein